MNQLPKIQCAVIIAKMIPSLANDTEHYDKDTENADNCKNDTDNYTKCLRKYKNYKTKNVSSVVIVFIISIFYIFIFPTFVSNEVYGQRENANSFKAERCFSRTGYTHYKTYIQCREKKIYKLLKKHTQNKYLRKKNGTKTFKSAL